MKNVNSNQKLGIGIAMIAITVAIVVALVALPTKQSAQFPASTKLVAENAILTGLPQGALFPFIDATPNGIVSAHIALTDATTNCSHDAAPPSNIVVLVGEAGGTLTPVMTAATNTGIGSSAQCVFHVTVTPGVADVPRRATDIVVVNAGAAPLTALNTITVTAEIR